MEICTCNVCAYFHFMFIHEKDEEEKNIDTMLIFEREGVKLPLYSTNVTSSLSVLSISVVYVQLVKQNCVCMQGSREGCPVCVCIPEVYI